MRSALRLLVAPLLTAATATAALADEPAAPPDEDVAPAAEPASTEPAEPAVVTSEPGSAGDAVSGRSYAESISVVDGYRSDRRSYAKDWLVAPPGWTFGGEMKFITANSSLFGGEQQPLRFADMALLSLTTRITASKRIELSGSLDVLAKQPDGSEEPLPQGGSLGLKIATSRRVAITTGVAGGPTLGVEGLWGQAGAGVIHRSHIEEFIAFQVAAGASATALRFDEMPNVWQADIVGSSELVFHTPRGEWAMWTGLGLALPAVHSEGIDPSTRLDVRVGTVFSAVKDWDIFAEFTLRDRGTTDMPGTVLPIADGGFDQKQLIVGITRRFTERGNSRWALAQD